MTKEKLADRIKQLIDISTGLLNYSIKLKELHDKCVPKGNSIIRNEYKTSEISILIRFLHCTFFYDVVMNLNTLLEKVQKDPDKKEQSFFELANIIDNEEKKKNFEDELKKLRQDFEDKNLHKRRNKFIGHKDINVAGDTIVMYLNFIKDEYIDYCEQLLIQMNELLLQLNLDVYTNNLFENLYRESLKKLIELLENELQRN